MNSLGRIPVERDLVIGFLRQQKSKGGKAWRRLQAVRAIEFYRTAVLGMSEPDLQDIRATLAKFVERRRRAAGPGEGEQDIDVVGQIDPNESDVIQNMRRRLRVLGEKWKTEKAYVGWTERFTAGVGCFAGLVLGKDSSNGLPIVSGWFSRQ